MIIKGRAFTNTVGGEYEYIHKYRVTNTNTKYSLSKQYTMCTFFADQTRGFGKPNYRHTCIVMHVHPRKRLCYYLSNWVRNEVAMRESFILPLNLIGACVDVHTI